MQNLAKQFDFSNEATPLPDGASLEILELAKTTTCSETAAQVLEHLETVVSDFRADKNIALACGLLLERQQGGTDMLSVWEDLQTLYAEDALPLRMLMRWYRRDGRVSEGLEHIARHYPDCWRSQPHAKIVLPGLIELKAWSELDQLWSTVSVFFPNDRSLRMDYIKALMEQSRFFEAAGVAKGVCHRERMGEASKKLLAKAEQKAGMMAKYNLSHSATVISEIVARTPTPRCYTRGENVVLFTGQLGTGGAERQMTRIACALKDRKLANCDAPPEVWVKHANPSTGADFYRPMLNDAGVPTRVMTEENVPLASEIDGLSDEVIELFDLLAPDIQRHTCQLIPRFREQKTDVAYLWQDGGIVQSALAALLAGVPRIVTSFRGLPPNLRPNFFREELPVLYAALAKLPHVTFTANSQKTAQAYEDWLSLEPGAVRVIPNAVNVMSAEGDDSDQATWFDIIDRSESCTKTVLGVFRFDTNKRPLEWIKTAARHLEKNNDTRFVMLGAGPLLHEAKELVEQLGWQDRIFILGIRNNVGFYMHRADLLMHLAQMEGLPNVLIEAQLVGTPVLATPAGGTDEVVTNGATGIILSNAAELPQEELDRALDGLLADENALARLGAMAMARSLDRFSVDTILNKTTALFDSAMQVN